MVVVVGGVGTLGCDTRAVTRASRICLTLASAAVATCLVIATQGDVEPNSRYILLGPATVFGLVGIGYWGGLGGTIAFAGAYPCVEYLRTSVFVTPAPYGCSEPVCDTWGASMIFVFPLSLFVVVLGYVLGTFVRDVRIDRARAAERQLAGRQRRP